MKCVKIIGVQTDEVTLPRMDGTVGSALYKVPLLLNRIPDSNWNKIFIKKWNNPRKFTTMYRPGIASIQGNRIILNGTTLEEVHSVHRDTLKLCVDDTNKELNDLITKQKELESKKKIQKNDFKKILQSIAKDIEF